MIKTTPLDVDFYYNYVSYHKKVDFVVQTDDDLIYIQVALSVRDEETLKRELKPLNDINDHYPKYLITMDYDNNNYNGIKQISAMDFLTGKINL